MPGRFFRNFVCAALLLFAAGPPARAAFSIYDTQTYDVLALGVPQFVNTNYIDLLKITQISRFRSGAGHDYSDATQFSMDAIQIPGEPTESCRSMKHYFSAPDTNAIVRAPVAGIVSRIIEEELGTQIQITSDVQPAFTFVIFHITTPAPAVEGVHVDEGQVLGHHIGTQTSSDIAVEVHTPTGYHLVSYFETLTDAAFGVFQARGIANREDMVISRETRDAAPFSCVGATILTDQSKEYVALTGGAANQQITVAPHDLFFHPGDRLVLNATSSAGLPVAVSSNAAKVCQVQLPATVLFRRRGSCILTFTQDGDAATFAAQRVVQIFTVLAPGAAVPNRPHLGAIYPPSATGPQSYLRFIANSGPGAVTLTLTDAATGQDKIHWTSPTIPLDAAPQFSIADIEATAPAGYQRPAMYGLRVENATTGFGSVQHVLYHPADGTLTNLTVCDSGPGLPTLLLGNVHTSRLSGFPSMMALHNTGLIGNVNFSIIIYDAVTGARLGSYLRSPPIKANSGVIVPVSEIEQVAKITPGTLNHYDFYASSEPGGFVQHIVNNQQAGVLTDMTAVCPLVGSGGGGASDPLRGGALFGGTQTSSQSFLRFYNANTFSGTVAVTLFDSATGAALGTWTSPSLAPFTEQQVAIGTLEAAFGTKRDNYEFSISTPIDGYFQHVLWRTADGTLTNLSSCPGATSADPYALIGVHSSLVGGQGYPSQVAVISTGASAQAVTLGIYDARDNSKLGTYTTAAIPAGAQVLLDVNALEAAAKIAPTGALYHYSVRAEAPFAGFLQHLVNNQKSGVITDMTSVCEM